MDQSPVPFSLIATREALSYVPVRGSPKPAVLGTDDLRRLQEVFGISTSWHLSVSGRGRHCYVMATLPRRSAPRSAPGFVHLARLILALDPEEGLGGGDVLPNEPYCGYDPRVVRFRNRNPLDLRRHNIELVSRGRRRAGKTFADL